MNWKGFRVMLKFAMPLYEAKYHEEDEWVEISELKLMEQLYKTYKEVSPAIKEMITGREIKTPYGIYRLKLKGGVSGGEQSELSAA
jgi:hypothetical protein